MTEGSPEVAGRARRDDGDDTEGHRWAKSDDGNDGDDTEGHRWAKSDDDNDGDDTEGHRRIL